MSSSAENWPPANQDVSLEELLDAGDVTPESAEETPVDSLDIAGSEWLLNATTKYVKNFSPPRPDSLL